VTGIALTACMVISKMSIRVVTIGDHWNSRPT